MSTIPDWMIRGLAERGGLIQPFAPNQLNPASYDVRLAERILIEVGEGVRPGGWLEVDISDAAYMMMPGEFVLASVAERLVVPAALEAVFCLKSSRGREGYQHMLSGYIDPGYEGNITLELHNSLRFRPLPLYAGMLIGQIRFATMASSPTEPYSVTGRYVGDATVTPSKRDDEPPTRRIGWSDFVSSEAPREDGTLSRLSIHPPGGYFASNQRSRSDQLPPARAPGITARP